MNNLLDFRCILLINLQYSAYNFLRICFTFNEAIRTIVQFHMLQLDFCLSSHFTVDFVYFKQNVNISVYLDTQLHGILPWVDINRNGNRFLLCSYIYIKEGPASSLVWRITAHDWQTHLFTLNKCCLLVCICVFLISNGLIVREYGRDFPAWPGLEVKSFFFSRHNFLTEEISFCFLPVKRS